MTASLSIPPNEFGTVRVFALSMTPDEIKALSAPGVIDEALGTTGIDIDRTEIVAVSDLADLGLSGYLIEGMGIPETQIRPDRGRLNALEGHALLVHSKAFGGRPAELSPSPALTLIGTYAEPEPVRTGSAPKTDSAKPFSGAPLLSPRDARAAARRAGAALFAGLLLLCVLLLVWLI